jgi:hypothetical protein
MNLRTRAVLIAAATAVALTTIGCNIRSGHASHVSPSPTPIIPSPINAGVCSVMSHCTASGSSYVFPNGNGGQITCKNGGCSDNTSYNSGYSAGYSDGLRDGETANAGTDESTGCMTAGADSNPKQIRAPSNTSR